MSYTDHATPNKEANLMVGERKQRRSKMKYRILITLIGACVVSANAALITATKDTTPTAAEVVNTDVIAAVNWGMAGTGKGGAVAVTINGVDFVTSTTAITTGSVAINDTYGTVAEGKVNIVISGVRGFPTWDAQNGDSGDAGLDTLFSSLGVNNSDKVLTVFNFSDLNIGQEYSFQLFESSGNQATRTGTLSQTTGTPTDLLSWNDAADGQSIITATWTADSATEQLTWTGSTDANAESSLNGFTFAQIPEPATIGVVAVFGGGLLFVRRKFMI